MSLQSTHPLTPAERDARRQNAQKSSGPRTPEGKRFSRVNATQHGHYAAHYSEAFRDTIRVLKEDPDEFERLRQRLLGDLAGSLPEDRAGAGAPREPSRASSSQSPSAEAPSDKPAGEPSAHAASEPSVSSTLTALPSPPALSALLVFAVEELAQLHWELDRERRCQNRLRRRRLAALDDILSERRAEIATDDYEDRIDRPAHEPGGLERAAPTANGFKAILHHLARLVEQVDRKEFNSYERSIWLIYDNCGEMSAVGSRILGLFRRLSGKYTMMPPPEADSAAKLRAELVAEIAKYTSEYEDFKPLWPVIQELDRERARNLEWLEEGDREWLEASREREEWLRTILAIRREARLDQAHQARMSARSTAVSAVTDSVGIPMPCGSTVVPGQSRSGPGPAGARQAATPVPRGGNTTVGDTGGTPVLRVGNTGGTPVLRAGPGEAPVPRRKSKNEGTNRGTHLESTRTSRPSQDPGTPEKAEDARAELTSR